MRRGLLVLQGAISVVLLIGAGLFVRSFHNVRSRDLGFQPEHVIVSEMSARGTPIDSARRIEIMKSRRERALTVPGVQHASYTLTIPFSSEWNQYLVVPRIDTASFPRRWLAGQRRVANGDSKARMALGSGDHVRGCTSLLSERRHRVA